MSQLRRFWNLHFLGCQLAISIVISIGFLIWVFWFNGSVAVGSILKGNRSAIYGTLAAIFGSLLGFVITALSIIVGYSTSERFDFLRKSKHYHTLWDILINTIRVLSVSTIVMVIGLIFDRDNSPQYLILCCGVFVAALSLFQLWNCLWVLERVIRIITVERQP
jgi:uncharacterized membrane protein YwzB